MKKNDRQQRILAELRLRPAVRIGELAAAFDVTTETVRRDLDELNRRGLAARTYGGAAGLASEPAVSRREALFVAERARIARLAVSIVQPGDVLMIDAGATTAHFARRIAAEGRDLTVITNAVAVASFCGINPSIRVVLCPGDFDADENAVFGGETHAFLRRFHANMAVFGAGGLTVEGPTDASSGAAWVKRVMLERAHRRILLADRAKFDVRLVEIVCPLVGFDDLVTDAVPPDSLRESLAAAGVSIHVAAEE